MVGLLDLPFTVPPLAELLSTKRSTLRLWSSCFHCHLTRTIANSSIWQISWSPTNPFHKDNNPSGTWSWTTTREPEDSSRSTAPRPPNPSSHDPSVKIRMVLELIATGMVRGLVFSSNTRTSQHQSYVGSAMLWSLPTKEKILKQLYLKDLPAKYPVAKFSNPWISWASGRDIWPDCCWPALLWPLSFPPCLLCFSRRGAPSIPSYSDLKSYPRHRRMAKRAFPWDPSCRDADPTSPRNPTPGHRCLEKNPQARTWG